MSKIVLSFQDDYGFSLIGISCHVKDYRICWELNKALNIKFERGVDYEIRKKKEISTFSFYEFIDEPNYLEFYLIANKGGKGNLISEQKTTDFFLLLKGNVLDYQVKEFIKKINTLDMVLTAFKIEPESLKSKQNLLF